MGLPAAGAGRKRAGEGDVVVGRGSDAGRVGEGEGHAGTPCGGVVHEPCASGKVVDAVRGADAEERERER